MNIITDTLDEIRNMKYRKVSSRLKYSLKGFYSYHNSANFISIVHLARTKLWHDCLLCPNDLEDFNGLH